MRAFDCPACSADLWFDSTSCEACDAVVAYDPNTDAMVVGAPLCAFRSSPERCNWVVGPDGSCRACARLVDHDPRPDGAAFHQAIRRALRQLRCLGLDERRLSPLLRFDLRASTPQAPVVTGHVDGLITLDTAEADPVHREDVRCRLDERYRTPLGHVRHEMGHWWWQSTIGPRVPVESFRSLFGDERRDYQQALSDHYRNPDDGSWRSGFVSHYAAAHPWEDFAESFAHVLHLHDTLETASVHGVDGVPDPASAPFDVLYDQWVDLTVTLNELNRSMGMPDPYPFVVAPPAIEKIRFVHDSLIGYPG